MNNAVLESPQRVSDQVISRCREEIDGKLKAFVRRILVPLLKWANGFDELGEGFQGPRSGRIKVGRGSRVGRYAFIASGFESQSPIVVGDLCLISRDCVVFGNDHNPKISGTPTRIGRPVKGRMPTIFESDVWIGARVLIREGVRIGEGAVVGAGALVNYDVDPYTIVAGVPAKKIGERFSSDGLDVHRLKVRAGIR